MNRALRRLFPTKSLVVRDLLRTVEKALESDASLLIVGESGVGKDRLAEAIHHTGARRRGPFIQVDCGAIPAELFESELFGYEKGAFTDAKSRKRGRFELATGGTLYLNEIASLPSALQPKLLRAVQEKRFSRVGGGAQIAIDARFISSSSLEPERLLDGVLRADLYYRLNVVSLRIPPLRERPRDIEFLARRFVGESSARLGIEAPDLAPETLELLRGHHWPGNVRQLEHVIERALLLEEGHRLTPAALPEEIVRLDGLIHRATEKDWSLAELEERYIREVLRRTGSNYSRTAKILGISRKTLLEKRKKYGLE